MRASLLVLASVLLSLVVGCSTDGPDPSCGAGLACEDAATVADAGTTADTGTPTVDSGTTDVDSATTTDSATTDVDSATMADSGAIDVDSGAACVEPGLGDTCNDTTPCPTGFDCDLGRCVPQGRGTCGGFAGAPCTDPIRSECVYETGHGDVGTCFSPAEVRCLCATDSVRWPCPV